MTESAKEDRAAVEATLQAYFDGIHDGDVERLRAEAFHPATHLYGSDGRETTDWPLDHYLGMVADRPSPASEGQARRDKILSIDFSGPNAAIAKVELSAAGKHFRDLLTLVRCADGWRIISKTFQVIG